MFHSPERDSENIQDTSSDLLAGASISVHVLTYFTRENEKQKRLKQSFFCLFFFSPFFKKCNKSLFTTFFLHFPLAQ